ncbi:MAG: hypothetical protein O2968_13600 [Acidobacteria bacterium]|nr:hypothetical protein [Acidobacteriota bacterium]
MTRFHLAGAGVPLLFFVACSIPVGEAPPEDQAPVVPAHETQVVTAADVDSPIDLSVRPEDLPIPPVATAAEIEAFHARVRRLSPTEFLDLPAALSQVLIERECLIPQAGSKGPLGNVIRGEFFAAGHESWAVTCSRNRRSQILAFRSASDAQPEIVEEFDDQVCMGEEWNCGMLYGTNINAVGGEYIVRHYEAYGGPVPPPIDHQGINVGIWEKASVVHYFHEGEWLTLTGAD